MYLDIFYPKITSQYTRKARQISFTYLAQTFLQQKITKPTLPPKLHEITTFPIIDKMNLLDKAKVPEKT